MDSFQLLGPRSNVRQCHGCICTDNGAWISMQLLNTSRQAGGDGMPPSHPRSPEEEWNQELNSQ